jgi:hypothetical protein
VKDISEDLVDFLIQHKMNFMSTYQLYGLWKKAKEGKKDISGVFQKLYSHPGGIFQWKETVNPSPLSFDLPMQ